MENVYRQLRNIYDQHNRLKAQLNDLLQDFKEKHLHPQIIAWGCIIVSELVCIFLKMNAVAESVTENDIGYHQIIIMIFFT